MLSLILIPSTKIPPLDEFEEPIKDLTMLFQFHFLLGFQQESPFFISILMLSNKNFFFNFHVFRKKKISFLNLFFY